MDYILTKPQTVEGYAVHRMVAGLLEGATGLHHDAGDTLTIRTDAPLPNGEGNILGFSLRACVSVKNNGRHRYFPTTDWCSRHAWHAVNAWLLLAVNRYFLGDGYAAHPL